MTTKKQKNGRSRDRLFVYKQTRDQGKERERERVPSHRFLHLGGTINNHLRSDPKHFWGRKLHILVIIDAAATTTAADNEGSRHTFQYLHCRRRSHKKTCNKNNSNRMSRSHTLLASPRVRVRNNTNNNNAAEQNQRKPGSQPASQQQQALQHG